MMKLEDRIVELKETIANERKIAATAIEEHGVEVRGLNAVISDLDNQLSLERSKIKGFREAMELSIELILGAR